MNKPLGLVPIILFAMTSAVSAQAPVPGEAEDPFASDFFLEDPFLVEDGEEFDDGSDVFIDDPFADTDSGEDEEFSDPAVIDDPDSIFSGGPMIEVVEDPDSSGEAGAADDFLVSEGVVFGGKFSGSFSAAWDYDYLYTQDFDFFNPSSSLTPALKTDLFFSARPESDYRVFGKLGFTIASGTQNQLAGIIPEGGVTFQQSTDEDGNPVFQLVDEDNVDPDDPNQTTVTGEDVSGDGGASTAINISVKELFADFDYESRVYFRFGKSMIKWGVGYFWSPTDVLNLAAIDVEDPTADREGPLAFKAHLPFDVHNAYLYVLGENLEEPLDPAVAAKTEFVIGNTELGVGVFYQRDLSPRLVATVSSSIGDVAVFGEGAVSYGSDRVFVRKSKDQSAAEDSEDDGLETVLDTYMVDDVPFFSATVGANYMKEFDDDAGTLLLIGQYFFNGEGYGDSALLSAAYRLALNSGENGLALPADEQPDGYEAPPALGTSDLTNFGMHYAGVLASWSGIFGSDLGFSTLVIANLSDLSGFIIPNVSYKFMERFSVSAGMRLTFGGEGDEYTNPAALIRGGDGWKGPTMSFTLECSIGGGNF